MDDDDVPQGPRAPRMRGLCVGLGLLVCSWGWTGLDGVASVAGLGHQSGMASAVSHFVYSPMREIAHPHTKERGLTEEGQDGRRAVEELHGCLGWWVVGGNCCVYGLLRVGQKSCRDGPCCL